MSEGGSNVVEALLEKDALNTELINKNSIGITLNTDQLAKNIQLSYIDDGFFSDNYFDLIPGEKKNITFTMEDPVSLKYFRKNLSIISLVDSYEE